MRRRCRISAPFLRHDVAFLRRMCHRRRSGKGSLTIVQLIWRTVEKVPRRGTEPQRSGGGEDGWRDAGQADG
jgi:hypothetical protein